MSNEQDLQIKNQVKNKDEQILSFLKILCGDSDNVKQSLKSLIDSVCGDNEPYKYSVIISLIYKKIVPEKNAGQNLDRICFNLRSYIEEQLKFDFEEDTKKAKNYKKCLEKLYDHINLESVRFNYLKSIENSTIGRIENSDKKIQEIEERHKQIQDDIDKQRSQYIVILGIFASIVLAFVGGMIFSSSVLSNMHKVGIYKLTFVMCFVALFFGNILFALFKFIKDINSVNDTEERKSWWKTLLNSNWCQFNLFFIVIICFDIVYFFDEFKNEAFVIFIGSK